MKKKFGFSLIEIIVGLIIVSVLLAALAPIITKRFRSSSLTVGAIGSSGSLGGGSNGSDDEGSCAGKQCSDGYYANKWEGCNCSACSASFCKKCENM